MTEGNEDWKSLQDSFDRMAGRFEQLANANFQSQQVHNHGEGKTLWICATCCMVMVLMCFMGFMWMTREFNRQDQLNAQFYDATERSNTYLSSIFGRVPDLKKAVEADYELRQKMKGQKDAQ